MEEFGDKKLSMHENKQQLITIKIYTVEFKKNSNIIT